MFNINTNALTPKTAPKSKPLNAAISEDGKSLVLEIPLRDPSEVTKSKTLKNYVLAMTGFKGTTAEVTLDGEAAQVSAIVTLTAENPNAEADIAEAKRLGKL